MITIDQAAALKAKNAKTVKWLGFIALGMFLFAFAQIQLYGLFCKAVGVNSLSSRQKIDTNSTAAIIKELKSKKVTDERVITVRFDATVNENLPWSFIPLDKKITVHPGELKKITYRVKNLTNEVITGQSIANVTPWQAEPFLSKIECFCHTKQTLQPGEEKDMPLLFTLSEDLPQEMRTLVVSYTFLNAEKASAKKYQKKL
ncbi:cytochrome c oxidase assembly protein [sulfur-oxidizing endosymbiont of Gigantopelta aegis]|uniref:cytochrome c oxidase assembly protein n=1 Tax=sulfur-oxidizing endosymbiont of Gigantopelta aegis TaxID=2794934 RepID=UPI0018DD2B1F|nr:cytochrome c oxidase assembly protein [sulfur-oxidizing endosymbiont of Gigantopelta aegis]